MKPTVAEVKKLDLWGLIAKASEMLSTDGNRKRALALYESWLANVESDVLFGARFNYGILLADEGLFEDAVQAYQQIIEVENPSFLQAYINLGHVYERQQNIEAALEINRRGIAKAKVSQKPEDKPLHLMMLNNLGRLHEGRVEYQLAEAYLTESLLLDPEQPPAIQHWVHLRQKLCEWPVYKALGQVTEEQQKNFTSMLAILAATDDPAQQLRNAQRYVEEKVRKATFYLSQKAGYRHRKIRIGYLSSDLCTHAVGILTAEMYALHDRQRFEVFAFCWSKEDGTPLRERIKSGVDRLIRIADMDDEQAARCIREYEIDVLIDLHGLTSGTRHNILTYRPSPIQVTYLGLPATTGIPEIDYVIVDDYVFPEGDRPFFTEKPLYIQPCFQVNDRLRQIGPPVSRAKYGLPEDKFVFCSFNNTYKITETMFSVWLSIIRQVENSVLWIMADNPTAIENLTQAAIREKIDPGRLFFAGRIPPAEYLARYQCADLFLDAFPFNGGTTASDSLWAGLPVLTLSGRSFASRYAGSLLRAVGLEELITHRVEDYEALAVEIAKTPGRAQALKLRLQQNRDSSTLFDTPRFVQKLDDALENLVRAQEQEYAGQDVIAVETSEEPVVTVADPDVQPLYVILVEPDLDELTKKVAYPAGVELVYFDPALEDKILSRGFLRSRFYDVSHLAKYSLLHQQSGQSALVAGQQMQAAIGEIFPVQEGFNWYYETFLYTYLYVAWYRLLGRFLVDQYAEIFGDKRPVFLIYDNPGYMYFHSFIPAISVVEALAGSACPFEVFNYGQGESPANGVGDVVPDLFSRAKMPTCSLLFHLPTVMYDKEHLEQYIQRFNPEEVIGISPHYWDQNIASDRAAPLVWTQSALPFLSPAIQDTVQGLCEKIRAVADAILEPLIATPFIRARQVKFFEDFARSQFIFFYALENYFAETRPQKILMADHDTGFHGPLVAFAQRYGIPITTFPHAKVSFHFPYALKGVRCLVHPVQGEGLLSLEPGALTETRTSFPEVLSFDTAGRRKIRTVGIVLNAMSGHGVLLRSLDEYMGSLKALVEVLRAHDVIIKLRARPGQTLYRRIETETGISIQQQRHESQGSMVDWGREVDLCLMYDTPTSGQIEFLKQSIPVAHVVLSDCAEWERSTLNRGIVPSLTLPEAQALLRSLIQDDRAYLAFRQKQFVAYLEAHCQGQSLFDALRQP